MIINKILIPISKLEAGKSHMLNGTFQSGYVETLLVSFIMNDLHVELNEILNKILFNITYLLDSKFAINLGN